MTAKTAPLDTQPQTLANNYSEIGVEVQQSSKEYPTPLEAE